MSFPHCTDLSFELAYRAPSATLGDIGHKIGQLGMTPDGSLWRLCKAGADISNPLYGAGCYDQPTDCGFNSVATDAGLTTLTVLLASSGTCTKDEYADGTIIIGAAVASRRFYHIKSNTASTATFYTTLTLYSPLLVAIAGTEWATIVPCPYRDVRDISAAAGFMSVVCFPLQTVTSTFHFWGKTRGPVFGVVYSTVPGAASNDRTIICAPADGSIRLADEAWNAGTSEQYLGYLIPRTGGTYAAGDQTFMLCLE